MPFSVRNERTGAAPADEVIAGTTFRCGGHDADTIWVWKDGTISKLKEAYDNGYLTAEQIAKVAEIWDTPSKRENLTLVIYDFHAGRELGRLSGNCFGVSPDGYLSIMFDVPGTDAELMQTFFPAYENGAFVIGRYSGRNVGLITYANDPVVHWTEQDGAYAPVTLPAFPGVTVTRDPKSGAPETEKRRLTEGPVAAFCSADLNGDGYPELFFLRRKKTADDTETPRTRCEFVIFDYHAGKTVLLVTIPEYDSLSFAVMDGALCLKDRTFDGQSIRYGFPIRYGDGTFSIDWIERAAGAAEESDPQRPTASRGGF